jgi:predicted RNase H-like HicB family nuclease
MNTPPYTYSVTWSPDDREHVGLCAEFPSLCWLAATPDGAPRGIQEAVGLVVADMQVNGGKRVGNPLTPPVMVSNSLISLNNSTHVEICLKNRQCLIDVVSG